MKPKEVYVEKKFNIGNYESETYGVVVEIEDGETAGSVIQKLRAFLEQQRKKTPLAELNNQVKGSPAGN